MTRDYFRHNESSESETSDQEESKALAEKAATNINNSAFLAAQQGSVGTSPIPATSGLKKLTI